MGPPRLGSHPILSHTKETSLAPPPHNCLIFSETVKTAKKKVGPAATETLHSGHTCKAPAQARNRLRRATGEPRPAPQLHGDPAPTLWLRPLAETAPRSKWREATPAVSAGSVSGHAPTREAPPRPHRPRPYPRDQARPHKPRPYPRGHARPHKPRPYPRGRAAFLPRAPGGRSGPAQQATRDKGAGPDGAAGNPSGSRCGAPRAEARPARRSQRPGDRGRRAGN